jgi:ribonuclease HII
MNIYEYENKLYSEGINFIGGVDEVGRGPLVGPVVASCVVLPKDFVLEGLTDSKKLSEKKRELFYSYIKEHALGIGIGIVSAKEIDRINILEATKLAMKKAIDDIDCQIDYLLIDGNMKFNFDKPYLSIVKGDSKSISIAAASVVAKVTRDRMMYELEKEYPQYEFGKHKGYPTKHHIELLKEYGIIEEYRKSFGPVRDLIEK